jgi:hypothetical protein
MLFPTQSMMMSSEQMHDLSYVELNMSKQDFSDEDFMSAKELSR